MRTIKRSVGDDEQPTGLHGRLVSWMHQKVEVGQWPHFSIVDRAMAMIRYDRCEVVSVHPSLSAVFRGYLPVVRLWVGAGEPLSDNSRVWQIYGSVRTSDATKIELPRGWTWYPMRSRGSPTSPNDLEVWGWDFRRRPPNERITVLIRGGQLDADRLDLLGRTAADVGLRIPVRTLTTS